MSLDWSVDSLVARGEVHETWADALRPVEPTLNALASRLSSVPFLPAAKDVFRALRYPLPDVRVVIVGQDPYPTPGHAVGLAFSTHADVRPLPRSLRNILTELASDIGGSTPTTGDLSSWSQRGVLLLNRTLTVAPGEPLSHADLGWAHVTDAILEALQQRNSPLVALAWGREAGRATVGFAGNPSIRVLESAHPSPLSASRGFFGSRPFKRANENLMQLGADPIDWSLP
jgi:uracil-DNA glycosylase